MKKNKIIFYAPVGTGVPEHMLGGGEKGCRRTREILKNADYDVIGIDKPVMGNGAIQYILMCVKAYFRLLKMLFQNPDAYVYVVGFYEKNIYMELLILATGKAFRKKLIYEARNGRLVTAYNEYGPAYKKTMKRILCLADVSFAQGSEYLPFIKNLSGKSAVYTPNYVLNRSLLPYEDNRPMNVIQLLYFGRVSESKNIDVVIKTASELKKKGYTVCLKIIGGYTEQYLGMLKKIIFDSGLEYPEEVIFTGQQPFETICKELQKCHFFIFPSKEKMEGHSNSLTEAMTFGVVPVVSTAGFNASIVAKKELVVENIDPVNFAAVVDSVITSGHWQEYSLYVYNRIKDNYTEDIVRQNILNAIDSLEK